jgi:hypothetical protein
MDGVALKTLTVSFNEYRFNKRLNKENRFGPWYTLTDDERDELGSTMGPVNPQALNRYSYVMGNPLKYTDPSGHGTECRWVPYACGVVVNNSSQPVMVTGERECTPNVGGCGADGTEIITVILWPGESSTDYGMVDADFITPIDSKRTIDGHGPDELYEIDGGTVTITNGPNGDLHIEPDWLWKGGFWKPRYIGGVPAHAIPPPINIPPNVSIEEAIRTHSRAR